MKRPKVNYIFHNPNSTEVTADYLLKILMESNVRKLERAIQEAADKRKCSAASTPGVVLDKKSNALAEEYV